jgi:hypothetical protein
MKNQNRLLIMISSARQESKRFHKILITLNLIILCSCSSRLDQPPVVVNFNSPAPSPSAEPHLFTSDDGSAYLTWVKDFDNKSEMYFSKLDGNTWTQPVLIDSGSNWFVNWADYPMMVSNQNNFMASYLAMSGPGKYSYDIKVTASADGGQTWMKPFALNDDGKEAEHGFTSFVPYKENFFVSWLDGRNTILMEMDGHHHDSHPSMSLRGAILSNKGEKLKEWELDNKTCDCCNTSSAITIQGPVVVYRDRSDKELRDISIVRLVNGTWTPPQIIYEDNWEINGCPVNGPRVIAQDKNVAVAWFSMPNQEAQVKVVFSDDAAETFSKPIRVDKGKPIGRVDLEWLDDDAVFVLWIENSSIIGARVERDGVVWSTTLSSSSEARSSGFPQVTRVSKNQLVLAWTDDQTKQVKTAIINL